MRQFFSHVRDEHEYAKKSVKGRKTRNTTCHVNVSKNKAWILRFLASLLLTCRTGGLFFEGLCARPIARSREARGKNKPPVARPLFMFYRPLFWLAWKTEKGPITERLNLFARKQVSSISTAKTVGRLVWHLQICNLPHVSLVQLVLFHFRK